MVSKSWLQTLLWSVSRNQSSNDSKTRVAILSFEAASSMAKIMHTWQSLSDKSVAKLRQEVSNSDGIRQLVSEDDDYIARLMSAEVTENLAHVAAAVSRLSKKCDDPLLRSFDRAFNDLVRNGGDAYGWRFSRKKMARKMRKMETFVVSNNKLYQAMETLADFEQGLKRMKEDGTDRIVIIEYEKRVAAKRQEVCRLKENSLWSRTFDYTVLLLARSLFTVYTRIGHVFGTDARFMDVYNHNGRRGYGSLMQSSVYPSKDYVPGKFVSMSGPLMGGNHDSSGFLSITTTTPIFKRFPGAEFFSGPLARSTSSGGPVLKASKSGYRLWQFQSRSHDKLARQKSNGGGHVSMSGPLTSFPSGAKSATRKPQIHESWTQRDRLFDDSTSKILNPPPETLGASALALHYANVIIFIEKLVASPGLIGQDARDSLYKMLPASIRATLRARLKPSTPGGAEQTTSVSEILEWLAPLAHNMIRWHLSRSIEHQSFVSKVNLFLVQTLYFANREKTEMAIVDLLNSLNSIWRFSREINA